MNIIRPIYPTAMGASIIGVRNKTLKELLPLIFVLLSSRANPSPRTYSTVTAITTIKRVFDKAFQERSSANSLAQLRSPMKCMLKPPKKDTLLSVSQRENKKGNVVKAMRTSTVGARNDLPARFPENKLNSFFIRYCHTTFL